jgi:catechol 2,3-dioxygenase-like lactoylglutathione lyase family enzyme
LDVGGATKAADHGRMKLKHRGICVSDLDRSTAFYRSALGFEREEDFGILEGPDVERRMQLPGVRVRTRTLRRPDGPVILLQQFLSPPASGPRTRRSTLQYGLVHLSFYVDDIDEWARRIARHGGAVWEPTRARYEVNRTTMLYCTDPDGLRIELMNAPGEAERFSHGGICVADIDASMAFYAALGFSPAENYVLDQGLPWLGVINEVPGIRLRAQMVRDAGGNTIELLKVFHPACYGPREPQPMNRFGLTHLAFEEDGQAPASVRPITDPDGVRIEFLRPGA